MKLKAPLVSVVVCRDDPPVREIDTPGIQGSVLSFWSSSSRSNQTVPDTFPNPGVFCTEGPDVGVEGAVVEGAIVVDVVVLDVVVAAAKVVN